MHGGPDGATLELLQRRLREFERGTGSSELPRHEPGAKQLQLDTRQLAMLLEGVPLDAPQRKRFVLPQTKAG